MDAIQQPVLPDIVPTVVIPVFAVIGILFGLWMWRRVANIHLTPGQSVFRSQNGREYLLEEEQRGDDEASASAMLDTTSLLQESSCFLLSLGGSKSSGNSSRHC